MRARLLLLLASFTATGSVVFTGCGPVADPAARADLDRHLSQIAPSEETFPPSESFLPMAFVVGQWTEHRITDDKGQASLLTYKLVGQENGAYWIEIVSETSQAHEATRMLVALTAGRDTAGMEIRELQTKRGQGPPVTVDLAALPDKGAQYRGALDLLAMTVETDQKDDIRVPAGHFIGCYEFTTTVPWGPWQTPSVVCSHPSVPLSGVVRATPVGKAGLIELVSFGITGAESEF